MIKGLYFDFDGTISDARRINHECMIETLDEFGYKYDKKKLVKLIGWKMDRIFRGLGLPKEKLKEFRKEFYEKLTRAALKGGIALCAPVEPLYELAKKYHLVVISNSETDFLKACIRKLKLDGLFSSVYGSEKFKTKDELLKKILKEKKMKHDEMIYVGDRFSDIDYARAAGCTAVAIHNSCSWSTLKEIIAEKPDYMISDFDGLLELVGKLNKE